MQAPHDTASRRAICKVIWDIDEPRVSSAHVEQSSNEARDQARPLKASGGIGLHIVFAIDSAVKDFPILEACTVKRLLRRHKSSLIAHSHGVIIQRALCLSSFVVFELLNIDILSILASFRGL